jgi:hypothetical protein
MRFPAAFPAFRDLNRSPPDDFSTVAICRRPKGVLTCSSRHLSGKIAARQALWYLLSRADEACLASNVEPFGPLAVTAPFRNMDDAIRQANRLPFGLAAYVMTHDLRNASAMSEAIQSGNLVVNHWQASLPETLFGGDNDSGVGSEGGIEGLQEFQTLKYVSTFAG